MIIKVNCKVFHKGEKVPTTVGSFNTNDYNLAIMASSGIALFFKKVAKQVSCIYEENRVNVVVYAPDSYPEPDIDDEVFDELVGTMFIENVEVAFNLSDNQ